MNIVIEGVDKVGKTTLCNLILEKFKDKLVYQKFPTEGVRDLILDKSITNIEKAKLCINEMESFVKYIDKDINYIIDRFWISTYIYQGNTEEIKEYILKRVKDGILSEFDIKYIFFIESDGIPLKILDIDIYERNKKYYTNKYKELFNNNWDLVSEYFDKMVRIKNNNIERTIKKIVDVLSPDLI